MAPVRRLVDIVVDFFKGFLERCGLSLGTPVSHRKRFSPPRSWVHIKLRTLAHRAKFSLGLYDTITVKINSLGDNKDNKWLINGLGQYIISVVHVYRWFRTLVFCPGLYENSSLPEISSLLCNGGSTTSWKTINIRHADLAPVCGSSPGAMAH